MVLKVLKTTDGLKAAAEMLSVLSTTYFDMYI